MKKGIITFWRILRGGGGGRNDTIISLQEYIGGARGKLDAT